MSKDLLKKFKFDQCSPLKTPMAPSLKLHSDLKPVNVTKYIVMISSSLYLIACRPYIMFSTCLFAIYQTNAKDLHFSVVKTCFRYLKGTPNLGLSTLKY